MAKSPKKNEAQEGDRYRDDEALERMNKALKGAMQSQPETHADMAQRRKNAERKAGRRRK